MNPHDESPWTHPICIACWRAQQGMRQPATITEPDLEICCFCGTETTDGIYVRQKPEVVHG